ncbi:exopolysaccharide biosynthesis protein [Legionella sp. D16C41]|uniref:exopolysaccharide biosynthesis protein n=1 Tax=Legionella sp. D16C41 TaxID=3402688 RepID=UPI003AF8F24A
MTKAQKDKKYPMSRALQGLADKAKKEQKITFKDIIEELGSQGFGLIIFLFALPSALPLSAIPGFSFIFCLPIIFITLQIIIGKHSLWLPKALAKREINKDKLGHLIKKVLPYLGYMEKLLKPRFDFMTSSIMEKVHALTVLILSILVLLPIPLSNSIFALIIIMFGLGLANDDGICLALAYLAIVLAVLFITSVFKLIFG